jgi:hypothetical protein
MSQENNELTILENDKPLDFATARSTYKIIVALLDQVDASSSLITLLASALGEKATQGVIQTSAWANYLTAKRALETLHPELDRFVATVNKLADKETEQSEQVENKE